MKQEIRSQLLYKAAEEYQATRKSTKFDSMIQSMHDQIHYWRIRPLDERYPVISFFLAEEPAIDLSGREEQLKRVKVNYEHEIIAIKTETSGLLNRGFDKECIQIKFLRQCYIFYTNVFNQKIFPERLKEVEEVAVKMIENIEKTISFLNAAKFLSSPGMTESPVSDEQEKIYSELEEHYLCY